MSALTDALLEARKNMQMPPMNGVGHVGKGGSREYKYATFQDVLKCVMPPLMEQGILLTQGFNDGTLNTVAWKGEESILLDSRSVNMSGTSQEQGSAETYAKRYALCSVFCIAGMEDDDGQAASGQPYNPKPGKFAIVNELKAEALSLGIDEESIRDWIEATYGGKSMVNFDPHEIKAVEGYLRTRIADKRQENG